jgi:hypothetical protein
VDIDRVDIDLADIAPEDTGPADTGPADTGLDREWLDTEPGRGLTRRPARPEEQIEGFGSKGPPLKRLYAHGDAQRLEWVAFICGGTAGMPFAKKGE